MPVVTPLQSAPQPDLLTAWLVVLRSLSAASADCLTVVLYLSTPEGEGAGRQDLEDGLQHSLETIGNEVPISERIGALPVSPWDINSVERVARAARWALTAPMLLEYPPPVSIPNPSIIDIGETAWLEIGQAGRGHILRIPSDMELQALGVAEKEKSLRQRRDEQTEHRNALEGQTRHRLRIHQEIDEVKSAIAQLTLFLKEVEQATVALRRLAKCPLCPAVDETRFEPRPGLFECICGSCKARWGTRRCTHCRRSYPYLLPALPANTDIDRSAGWIDRVVGSDVLAVPVSLSLHDGFICPHCGARRVEGLSSGRT